VRWDTALLRRGLTAGLVATTAMNLGYAAERQLRRNVKGPLDYDDTNIPVLAAARLLRRSELSPAASRALGFTVHWGYGSLAGLAAVPLARRYRPVTATAGYLAGIAEAAGAGVTPAPEAGVPPGEAGWGHGRGVVPGGRG